jgi:O-antigen/teichoic acid export membrane protein
MSERINSDFYKYAKKSKSIFSQLFNRGASASFIGLYFGLFGQYLLHFVAAKVFQMNQYGHIALALTVVGISSVLLQLGFSHAVVKYIGVYDAKKELGLLHGMVRGGGVLCLLSGTVFALIGIIGVRFFPIGEKEYMYALLMGFVILPASTSLLYLQNVARGFGRMYLATLPHGFFVPFITILMTLIFLPNIRLSYLFLSIYAGVAWTLCFCLGYLVSKIPAYARARKHKPRYSFGEWLKTSLPMMASVGLTQLLQRGDIIILSLFVPAQSIGIYSLASRFAQSITFSNRAFNRYWAVTMARLFSLSESQNLQRVLKNSARATFLVSMMMSIVLLVFGDKILGFFGAGFSHGYYIMLTLLVGNLVSSYFAPGVTFLQMSNHERDVTKILFAIAVGTIFAYSVLVPVFRIWGAAVVTSTSVFTVATISALVCKRNLGYYVGAF